jgi:complement component 1 Q subcomponent-binding protein
MIAARQITRAVARTLPKFGKHVAKAAFVPTFVSFQARNFSATKELADVLASEIVYENREADQEPDMDYEEVKDLISKKFKISDREGHGTVVLTRTYKGESIMVTFDCQDEVENEGALESEMQKRMDAGEDAEIDADSLPENSESMGIAFEVVVEKKSGAKLIFNCVAADTLQVQSITSITADIAKEEDSSPYNGPHFSNLDEKLQNAFLDFLAERSIDDDFKYFFISYSRYKEEREYRLWLNQVVDFVESK